VAAMFTRKQPADAVAAARDGRGIIQASLLHLDGSFGKRLLAGATLTGITIVALGTLLAAGRWTRLSSELDLLERRLASATSTLRDAERAVAALLSGRDELRELPWTASYDLNAATDAGSRFQQAVLAMGAGRR
jgi:hypothetical protein